MKAIASNQYGSAEVFQHCEINKPQPKPHQVLVRNHATTVTGADIMMREGKPFVGRLFIGLRKPKSTVLGFEFAGEVEQVGEAVTRFKVGDKVFGGTTHLGCYAEYVCVNENDVITTIPDNISYEEAAPVNGSAVTVMNFLRGLGNIQANQKILINGASGGLGTYAVQIAKYFGAEVTGVCSTPNVEMVKSIGADSVIDYLKEDFTKNGIQYDLIFDTVGKRSFAECKKSLASQGVYLSAVLNPTLLGQMMWTAIVGGKKAKSSATGMLPIAKRLAYFEEIKTLLATGKIKTVIDNRYTLAQMAEAHRYVEKGHKKGNIVITI